jgi:hypothetical protein
MALLKPEAAIRKLLIDDATLGAAISTRLYPGAAPEKATFPLGIYERRKGTFNSNMTGRGTLRMAEITLAFYAWDYLELGAICTAAINVIDGYRGAVTIGADSVYIDSVLATEDSESVLDVLDDDGSSDQLHSAEQVFQIAWADPVPA